MSRPFFNFQCSSLGSVCQLQEHMTFTSLWPIFSQGSQERIPLPWPSDVSQASRLWTQPFSLYLCHLSSGTSTCDSSHTHWSWSPQTICCTQVTLWKPICARWALASLICVSKSFEAWSFSREVDRLRFELEVFGWSDRLRDVQVRFLDEIRNGL